MQNEIEKKRIYFFKDYLKEVYGKALYRVPINLGFGCPHKNKSSNGCIFCSENGALARHLKHKLDIDQNIEEGIKYIRRRYDLNANEFIAYLQSYTNTYSDIATIKDYYEKILTYKEFKVLIISTRSDSISDDVYSYLEEISKRIDLIVELGVQTTNSRTLEIINRQHTFESVELCVKRLKDINIKTVAHLIIGLPNETYADYERTIKDIVDIGVWGIKIHNMLVVKNSELGSLYNKFGSKKNNTLNIPNIGNIPTLNEYEYINILIKLLTKIPDSMPILRLTADEDIEKIIEPKWKMSKGEIIQTLVKTMTDLDISQGKNLNHKNEDEVSNYLKIETKDSSLTFYNNKYKQCYHSKAGARSEAIFKFIKPSLFEEMPTTIKILDIGFGLGYNAVEAIKEAKNLDKNAQIISLEFDNTSIFLAKNIYPKNSFEYVIISSIYNTQEWSDKKSSIKVLLGDARQTAKIMKETFDLIYLDPFSPDKNPELWSFDFIKTLKNLLSEEGTIITYSASFAVRGAMLRNKLFLGYTEAFGRKNGGTIASKDAKKIKSPINEKDSRIILKTTSGTAYRDPNLSSSYLQIMEKRQKLISKLKDKGIPKWM